MCTGVYAEKVPGYCFYNTNDGRRNPNYRVCVCGEGGTAHEVLQVNGQHVCDIFQSL